MSKIMKIIAVLLVIAAAVFVAGCASQSPANNTAQVTPTSSIANESVNQSETSANVPAGPAVTNETNSSVVNQTDVNATINSDNNGSSDNGTQKVSLETIKLDKIRDAQNLSDNTSYENNTSV